MAEAKETLILFQGDSITDGKRLRGKENEWDLNHQMGHGYAFIVNARLGAQYPQSGLMFVNRGISGNRVADLYGRWKEDTLNLRPDVLSVLVGINDVGSTIWEQSGSDPARYARIYRMLLDEMLAINPQTLLVLMEPFVMPVGAREKDYEAWISLLRPLQREVKRAAGDYHAVYVPLQERFERLSAQTGPAYWCWDGVHPTVCGHQVIAEAWMEQVVPHLNLH